MAEQLGMVASVAAGYEVVVETTTIALVQMATERKACGRGLRAQSLYACSKGVSPLTCRCILWSYEDPVKLC